MSLTLDPKVCPPDQRFRLKPGDTCDRCGPGTQALVLVRHPEQGDLRFCAHHYSRHELALIAAGFETAERVDVPA